MKAFDINYVRLRQEAHDLHLRGWETNVIAEKLGLSKRQVRRYICAPRPNLGRVDYHRQTWRDDAACKAHDTELFFPTAVGLGSTKQKKRAMQICAGCPVAQRCYDTAIANCETVGVWGGKDFAQHVYEFDSVTGEVTVSERGKGGPLPKVG